MRVDALKGSFVSSALLPFPNLFVTSAAGVPSWAAPRALVAAAESLGVPGRGERVEPSGVAGSGLGAVCALLVGPPFVLDDGGATA